MTLPMTPTRLRLALFASVARRLGGRLRPDDDVIEASVDGVALEIETVVSRSRDDSSLELVELFHSYTMVRARAPELVGNNVSIGRRDGSTPPAALLGVQETATGDARFDARFLVYADVPARACAWLGAELRAAISACDRWAVAIEDGTLQLAREGEPASADELCSVARLAASLAHAERTWRARWLERAAWLDAEPLAGPDLELEMVHGKTRVTIAPDVRGRHGCVCVRAPLAQVVDERFEIKLKAAPGGGRALDIRATDPGTTARRLVPGLRATVLSLAPRLVHFDGRLAGVDLDGAEPEREHIERAVRLVAVLAGELAGGPYR